MSDCLFCKIINGDIPADKVYEDNAVLGFNDINPVAPHHVLFIPRKHISTVNELEATDAELVGKLFLAAQQHAATLGVDADGYRLTMNTNASAGQTVFHIHLHMLAGRPFSWPPG
jgi:histidine triad (HIT) family protein